jgi:drug/metabolite transporter (DMT)-like permease
MMSEATTAASRAAVPWAAYGSLAASMALVGSYVGLSKLLVAVFPVFLLALLRFGIAAVAMAPWLRRQPDEAPLSARDKRLLFVESLFGNFLFSVCMLWGVKLTSALAAGIVMSSIPAVCALLGWLILRERIGARVWLAIACAALGIGLLALARDPGAAMDSQAMSPMNAGASAQNGLDDQGQRLLGYALLFAAVCCEALYVVIGKKLTAAVSAKRISALINLWGLALVAGLGLWQARDFAFGDVGPWVWVLLLFYALAASMWTVWLWMTGLKRVQAAAAGVFTVFLPIAAALVGVLFLGERFGPAHLAAFGFALAGLLIVTWPRRGGDDAAATAARS